MGLLYVIKVKHKENKVQPEHFASVFHPSTDISYKIDQFQRDRHIHKDFIVISHIPGNCFENLTKIWSPLYLGDFK